jgi:hypothetical protein
VSFVSANACVLAGADWLATFARLRCCVVETLLKLHHAPQDGGIDARTNSGLGVSMANMLFDSKEPTSATSSTTSSQSHQAFVSGLTQHFETLSLHGEARNGVAGGYEQAAMPTFPVAHVAAVPPRPTPGEDVHLQPQIAIPQHPHIPYFPIYPHMLPPGASDVRYVPVDTAHPAMDASYAQQYAGIPAISTAGGILTIPSMPYVQLMPMVQQPIAAEDGSVEGVVSSASCSLVLLRKFVVSSRKPALG